MNNITSQNIEANYPNDDSNEILKNLINYFELTPKTLEIKIPYNLNNALDNLKYISLHDFTKGMILEENNQIIFDEEQNFSIDNVQILTSKLEDDEKTHYILLKDLKKENYISMPEYLDNELKKIEKGINLRIAKREDGKKEIYIHCVVNYQNFIKNMRENMIEKSKFEKAKSIFEKSKIYMEEELSGKNLEFVIKIYFNSIKKVIYTENGEFLFDLQFQPIFQTNFFNKFK